MLNQPIADHKLTMCFNLLFIHFKIQNICLIFVSIAQINVCYLPSYIHFVAYKILKVEVHVSKHQAELQFKESERSGLKEYVSEMRSRNVENRFTN